MATQTPVEQRSALPIVQEDLRSSHGTTLAAVQPKQAEIRAEAVQPMQAAQVAPTTTVPSRAVENSTAIALAAVGLAVVATCALFAAGLWRTRLEAALRRVVDSTYEMRIPMLLPVTLVEVARELVAGRQEASSFTADHRSTK